MLSRVASARFALLFTFLNYLLTFAQADSTETSLQTRQSSNKISSAVFNYAAGQDPSNNLTFALNVAKNSDGSADLAFTIYAPGGSSWVAFGVGNGMKDALMFVVYEADDGKGNIIVSPRWASSHTEPTYAATIDSRLTIENNGTLTSGVNNGTFVVHAICAKCANSPLGVKLDIGSRQAPFIWAFGPGMTLKSNSKTADLRQHDFFGKFTMDMVQASSGERGVPYLPGGMNGAKVTVLPVESDSNRGSTHAVVMCFCFVVLMPLAVILLRVFSSVKWHMMVMGLALLGVLGGAGIGIWASMFYNKSKHFNTAHQIIGLLVVGFMLIQLGLGLVHHHKYLKTQQPTIMIRIHRYLGPALISLGVVNACLGFNLSFNNRYIIPLLLIFVAMMLLVTGMSWLKGRRNRSQEARNSIHAQNFHQGVREQQQSGGQAFVPGSPPPPQGGFQGQGQHMPPPYGPNDIQMNRMTPSPVGGQPVAPRPMV